MTTVDTQVRPATPTERMVAAMLVENTGGSILDSGMYGRAWQRTRSQFGLDGGLPNSTFSGLARPTQNPSQDDLERVALAMREAPTATLDRYGSYTKDAFHFLVENLDYDPGLDAKFQRWCEVTNYGKDSYGKDWGLPLMERFVEQLAKKGAKIGGIYGDSSGAVTENSYNHEDALDRTIQLTLFTVEDSDFLPDGSYILLQVHGGADVRGGYTDPRLFGMDTEYGILDWGRGYLSDDGDVSKVGQLDIEGRMLTEYDVRHQWDSENAGIKFNLDGMWGQGQTVLVFDDYWLENERGAVRAIWDEEREIWLCPLDNSPLVAW